MTSTSNTPQGLKVHSLASYTGRRILARQKIDSEQFARAVAAYEAAEHVRVATSIGVHKRHGFFFSTDPQWSPHQPDAFADPIGNIPWVQIHELLGRLPEGSTADFLNTNGTLN